MDNHRFSWENSLFLWPFSMRVIHLTSVTSIEFHPPWVSGPGAMAAGAAVAVVRRRQQEQQRKDGIETTGERDGDEFPWGFPWGFPWECE